jgi:Tfp pilus assembly protein PilO
MFGGIAITVLLVVASWFLLIHPKYTEASDVRGQVEDTQTQLIALRKKIAGLNAQKAQLPRFKAALKTNQRALPSDSGIPDFLRQLQASGAKTDVSISGFTVSSPAQVKDVSGVWQLPIALIAGGKPDGLGKFLNELQAIQPRALLIQSVGFTQGSADPADSPGAPSAGADSPTDSAITTSLNLGLMAYVAPPAGAGAPIVTTK